MKYDYKNDETGEIIEKEFSMKDAIPAKITENGKEYSRVWTFGGGGVHIPFQWGQETNIKSGFKKSPSQKKHFY